MKKILLGTSALLVAGMISGAAIANPVTLNVGGYANWYIGIVDFNSTWEDAQPPGSYSNIPISGEVEINFSGETVLNNGLRIGAMVSVQTTDSTNPRIEGSYVFVDSAYGRVTIGQHAQTARQFHTGAKDVGLLGLNASRVGNFLPFYEMVVSTDIRTMDYAPAISFISPSFHGFSAAVSYMQGRDNVSVNTGGNNQSGSITLAYSNVFNGVSVDADLSFAMYDGIISTNFASMPNAFMENEFSLGARVGFEGFTFGAGFRMISANDGTYSPQPDTNSVDGMIFNVGVSFEDGPFGISLAYVFSEFKHKTGGTEPKDRQDLIMLSGSYTIAPGVETFASFAFSSRKINEGDTMRGYGLITGLGLSF